MNFLTPTVLGIMMSCTLGMCRSIVGERENGELTRLGLQHLSTVMSGNSSKL